MLVGSGIQAMAIAGGYPADQAMFMGSAVSSVVSGFSLEDWGEEKQFSVRLQRETQDALTGEGFELPDYCRAALKGNLFNPETLLDILCKINPRERLKSQFVRVCSEDPECSLKNLPVDQIIDSILKSCDETIKANRELEQHIIIRRLHEERFPSDVHFANQQYADSFVQPLFLHKDNPDSPVTLKNLYVSPKCKDLKRYSDECEEEISKDFSELFRIFIEDNSLPFLFIEGDAGCGKTTLASWMNYYYMLGDEISTSLFGGRPLLTIRLRDLDKKSLNGDGKFSAALLKYMNFSSFDDLERKYPRAILLLDGFDELCMIEKISGDYAQPLYQLYRAQLNDYKIIVTTRPKFIEPQIDIPSMFFSLQHFDSEQRETWIKQYTSPDRCGQIIDPAVMEYIQNSEDESSSCICDTPLTLYMLAAKEGIASYLENDWALYHHIFLDTLSETEYNKMFPEPDRCYAHDIEPLKEMLYRISEEIAYEMYKTGNSKFSLSEKQLTAIVNRLSSEFPKLRIATTQNIAEQCYALCCYWKSNADRGAVEFLHNTIRDFFLAEKICREMDKISDEAKGTKDFHKITDKLCAIFPYGKLDAAVLYFIDSRTKYNKLHQKNDFAKCEYENRWIPSILQDMSDNGIFRWATNAHPTQLNPVQCIQNIVKCTVQIYRMGYESYLQNDEKIPWSTKESCSNNILISLFDQVFEGFDVFDSFVINLGSRGDFSNINIISKHLKCADFSEAIFGNLMFKAENCFETNFSNAELPGADLCGADLRHADFSNVNLHNADLRETNLDSANLSGANLDGADLRSANLCDADISGVDFRNVRIDDVVFSDGYYSYKHEEQIEHLKSMNIPGLIVE